MAWRAIKLGSGVVMYRDLVDLGLGLGGLGLDLGGDESVQHLLGGLLPAGERVDGLTLRHYRCTLLRDRRVLGLERAQDAGRIQQH